MQGTPCIRAAVAFVVYVYYLILLLCAEINTPSKIFQTHEIVPEKLYYYAHHATPYPSYRISFQRISTCGRKLRISPISSENVPSSYTGIWISMTNLLEFSVIIISNKIYQDPLKICAQMWHNVDGRVLAGQSMAKPCNLQTDIYLPEKNTHTTVLTLHDTKNVWFRSRRCDFVLLFWIINRRPGIIVTILFNIHDLSTWDPKNTKLLCIWLKISQTFATHNRRKYLLCFACDTLILHVEWSPFAKGHQPLAYNSIYLIRQLG